MKIYVASSWRNPHQQDVVALLRNCGHEVYDFKNPPLNTGFSWREVDPNWQNWTPQKYRDAMSHPRSEEGFKSDFDAMRWADAVVLVQPCGNSAHLELGWAVGANKLTAVLFPDGLTKQCEPELMAKLADSILIGSDELVKWCADTHALINRVKTALTGRTS